VPEESSMPEESVMAETTVPKATPAKTTVAKTTVAAEPAMGRDHARAKRCAAVRTGNRKARGGSGSGSGSGSGLCRGDAAEQHRSGQRAGTQSTSGRAAD
jgi:hypothetical protein